MRFICSLPSVSREIVTWGNFLYAVLGTIPIWLPRKEIDELMPDCFKELYPNTRVIIDCTEIKTQQPSSLVLNSQMYSSYKSSCTLKCLLGIAPHGAVTFVSPLYTGCMSDVEITITLQINWGQQLHVCCQASGVKLSMLGFKIQYYLNKGIKKNLFTLFLHCPIFLG